MELDELNDFFASDETRAEDDDGPEADPRSLKPTPIKRTPPRIGGRVPRPGGEEVDGPGPAPTPDPAPDPTPDPDPRPGPVPHPRQLQESIELENVRNLLPDAQDLARRQIWFTPPVSGEVGILVEATGLSAPERLTVAGVSAGRIVNGGVVLKCEKGKRASVTVEFDSDYAGPIELSAYEAAQSEESQA